MGDGCGRVWLGVGRCGWVWLGALFRTAHLHYIWDVDLVKVTDLCTISVVIDVK